MSIRWVVLMVPALALAPACKKEKKSDAPKASGDAEKPDRGENGDEDPGGGASEAEAVRAPTAADLATYTEGLTGDGPLMATFVTTQGSIHCELLEKDAPLTVANFVGLARGLHRFRNPQTREVEQRPYYDGTVFHRVIPGFMVQGGDPTASGTGDPGYEFATEWKEELKHIPGTLSMANGGPDTNGSQFFITETAQPSLDGKVGTYNVFGRCKDLDVVKKLAAVEKTAQRNGERSRPVNTDEVKLDKVIISRGMPPEEGSAGGEAGGAGAGDKKDEKGKDVKRLDKPENPPTGKGEPDHHDK